MKCTKKQIENAYGLVIHRGVCDDKSILWTAYDKYSGGWIDDGVTLEELVRNIDNWKAECDNEN